MTWHQKFTEANYQFLKDSGYLMVPDDFKLKLTIQGWQSALEESNKQDARGLLFRICLIT